MIERDYIESVLARFEGGAADRGYVPCERGNYKGNGTVPGEALGISGVTVATGVDLGQQTLTKIESMGVSETTLDLLAPYVGLRKKAAIDKLTESPLVLTAEQVKEIDRAVHNRYIEEAVKLFGRERFCTAPKEVQAVAVSLYYQFGYPRRSESPALEKAWESLVRGKYREAAEYLRRTEWWSVPHRVFMRRRNAESALLSGMAC